MEMLKQYYIGEVHPSDREKEGSIESKYDILRPKRVSGRHG
uniref:Putative cytochrome b5 outer mitochondrial membrane variant 1 n=1 Tax=Taeniopygia guttata TaxID=59729 RepID=B5FYJ6_TAEGU|nr:putative cytochrome b5 outer mitochondrial membrane precursor variant 1 [Taeniopygia guttata]